VSWRPREHRACFCNYGEEPLQLQGCLEEVAVAPRLSPLFIGVEGNGPGGGSTSMVGAVQTDDFGEGKQNHRGRRR
jgi:hypothetical protein